MSQAVIESHRTLSSKLPFARGIPMRSWAENVTAHFRTSKLSSQIGVISAYRTTFYHCLAVAFGLCIFRLLMYSSKPLASLAEHRLLCITSATMGKNYPPNGMNRNKQHITQPKKEAFLEIWAGRKLQIGKA